MKRILTLLLILPIFTQAQQTWASLSSTQGVSWGALLDAVNTGVIVQKQAFPTALYRLVEKDSVNLYVNNDVTNTGFSAKANNQIITKADITKASTTYTINVFGKYSATTAGRYVWYSINDANFTSPTRLTLNAIGSTTGAQAGTITATTGQTVYIAVSDATQGPTVGVDPFNTPHVSLTADGGYPASAPTACNTGASSFSVTAATIYVYITVLANGLACSVGSNESSSGILN